MAFSKIILNNNTLVDMTDATATSDKIFQNYSAYGADGQKVIGSASSGVGSGYTLEDFADGTNISGNIVFTGTKLKPFMFTGNTSITGFSGPNVTRVDTDAMGSNIGGTYVNTFQGCSNLVSLSLPNVTDYYHSDNIFRSCTNLESSSLDLCFDRIIRVATGMFSGCSKISGLVFPRITGGNIYSNAASYCASLIYFDFGKDGTNFTGNIAISAFRDSTSFNTLIIRYTNQVVPLSHINAFTNTPFASGKTGGTLYVPNSLISSYQSATNWSTILSYTNNQILAIEDSYYETHYADGTEVPTT